MFELMFKQKPFKLVADHGAYLFALISFHYDFLLFSIINNNSYIQNNK